MGITLTKGFLQRNLLPLRLFEVLDVRNTNFLRLLDQRNLRLRTFIDPCHTSRGGGTHLQGQGGQGAVGRDWRILGLPWIGLSENPQGNWEI